MTRFCCSGRHRMQCRSPSDCKGSDLAGSREDLEWETGKFSVKGAPQKSKTIREIAFAAYTNHPQGMEAGLEATSYYDPPQPV
jgi:CO/xanthine dehydrogenase Mo-binding subunit